jgi:uncharacterized protein (TIGR02145 family)
VDGFICLILNSFLNLKVILCKVKYLKSLPMNKNITFKWLFYLFLVCILFSCKKKEVPTITTSLVVDIRGNTAVSGGIITDDGGATIIAKGVCWSTNEKPTTAGHKIVDSTASLQFASKMSGLSAGLEYHVRAFATNTDGTGYGDEKTFTTPVMDIDGNVYNTVTIATHTWMIENLKVTHFIYGMPLMNITDNSDWESLAYQGYCWYNNDSTYRNPYGALYNPVAVESRSICPYGWHIATVYEWDGLINYLGGPAGTGGKLKEAGITNWLSPNTGATNETGFTALPAGMRNSVGDFLNIGSQGTWWCQPSNSGDVYSYSISYDSTSIVKYHGNINMGFSVRCVKDH